MAGSYLKRSRHGTIYYFRRRVPDDLRSIICRTAITKSLGTESRREATIIGRACAAATDELFKKLRTMRKKKSQGEDDCFRIDYGQRVEIDLGIFGKSSLVFDDVKPEDQPTIDSSIEKTTQSIMAMLPALASAHGQIPRTTTAALPPAPIGMPLSEAIPIYLEGRNKATTRRTYEGRLNHAQAFFGANRDIRQIEQVDLSSYARHALGDIANTETAGFHITTLCGLINWFRIQNGWGPELTTKTLIPKSDKPAAKARDAFTVEQVAVLFDNALRYREKQPCKYWVTVASAFMGGRIEELAQVNLHTDLRKSDKLGIWFLDLNGDPDPDSVTRKSMKNLASWRHAPIHSALVEHGFVDFLVKQREAGYTRPFESQWGPYSSEEGTALKWSHYITNWGGRELEKLRETESIADPDQKLGYFHSLRHTVTGCMERAGVPEHVADAVVGHAHVGEMRERYGKLKFNPDQLSSDGVEPGLVEIAALLTPDIRDTHPQHG